MSSKNSKIDLQCVFCQSKESTLFSELQESELEVLAEHKSCVTYKKGQTLFYEGTRPMGVFFNYK
jgi:CRP-like cAMP-binding protein